jgi:hypothetical protein
MNQSGTPTKIINLDLQLIGRQSLIFTIVLSFTLLALNGVIHQDFDFFLSWIHVLIFIVGYIILIILHEISHLIGFIIFANVPLRSLKYGFNLKLGIAYATTNELVQNKSMKRVLILPFWVTGALPTLLGLLFNNSTLVLLGAWLIAGATGDFAMYKELRKVSKDAWIKDDPELPKLYVYEDK